MTTPTTIAPSELDDLVNGSHHDPHSVLGAHPAGTATVIRTLRPEAEAVSVVVGSTRTPLERIHDGGVFAAEVPGASQDYRLEVTYHGNTYTVDDPYRWLPTLGEIDLHLIGEGRHEQLWDVLGAHERSYDTPGGTVSGVSFAVWAPSANGIRITGDFDYWSGRALPMRSLGTSGVWELFVPGVGDGTRYKFEGGDADWQAERAETTWYDAPMSVYEVHLGSWRQGLSYLQLADELTKYVKDAGFTHVEFMPVMEHPFGGSWGYHPTSY